MGSAKAACDGRLLLPSVPTKSLLPLLCLGSAGCWSGAESRESADHQVYPLIDWTTAQVTGLHKTFPLERPVDTLRSIKGSATSSSPSFNAFSASWTSAPSSADLSSCLASSAVSLIRRRLRPHSR